MLLKYYSNQAQYWDVVLINTCSTWICTVSLSLLWSVCLLLQDKAVALWDIISPTEITLRATLKGHEKGVCAVELSESNIISGSVDKTIKVQSSCVL